VAAGQRLSEAWRMPTAFDVLIIFERPDGSYGFKEFRRDPEDAGRWTLDLGRRLFAPQLRHGGRRVTGRRYQRSVVGRINQKQVSVKAISGPLVQR
jgi:hypothetical protein